MRIGELTNITKTSHDTIRYYEKLGIIKTTHLKSESNNYKDYHENSIERIKSIQGLKEAGMTLKEVKHLFEAIEKGSITDEYMKNLIENKIAEIDLKIINLNQTKKNLEQQLKDWCTPRQIKIMEKIR